MVTVTAEVNQHLDLMPSTSGRATGGNAMLRYAQLETMMEGSDEYRTTLVNSNGANNNRAFPTQVNGSH